MSPIVPHLLSQRFGAVVCASLLLLLATSCGSRTSVDAEVLAESGQEALRTGDAKSAADQFARAARATGDNGALQYDLGQAEFRNGNLKAAARAFENAAALLNGDDAVDALLALARVRVDQRRWKDATDALQRARGYASAAREADILAALGGVEFRQGLGDAARKNLAEALFRNIDHPLALYNLGCVFLYHYQDKPAALRAFKRYLAVAPVDEEANRRLERHIAALEGAVEGTSAAAAETIRRSRGTSSAAEAASIATTAAQEDPLSPEALLNYAQLMFALGTPDATEKARQAWVRLAHLAPTHPALAQAPAQFRIRSTAPLLEKAAIALSSGNRAAAKTHYREACTVDPLCYDAWMGLVSVHHADGNFAAAAEAMEQANLVRPNRPDNLLYLGSCYAANPARTADAIRCYHLFLRHDDGKNPETTTGIRNWLLQNEKGTQP